MAEKWLLQSDREWLKKTREAKHMLGHKHSDKQHPKEKEIKINAQNDMNQKRTGAVRWLRLTGFPVHAQHGFQILKQNVSSLNKNAHQKHQAAGINMWCDQKAGAELRELLWKTSVANGGMRERERRQEQTSGILALEEKTDRYLLIDSKWAILGGEILGVHVSVHSSIHSG